MSIGVRLVDVVPFGVDTPGRPREGAPHPGGPRMTAADAARRRPELTVSFQGRLGAYSHMACRQAFPELFALPCHSFEDAFAAVRDGQARYAMIAVDNTVAGRVADVHHLLPRGGLHIVGEQFVRVNHQLLGVPGATLEGVQLVESHVHALGQCRDFLRRHGLQVRVVADTAGAPPTSPRPATRPGPPSPRGSPPRSTGWRSSSSDIEDAEHNTTRFLVLARDPRHPDPNGRPGDDHLHLPRPQPPGRALQGAGRLRHQRRQHGQARELRRRRLHPGRVPGRHHGPSAARQCPRSPSRSCASSPTTSRSWASTRRTGFASAWAEPYQATAGIVSASRRSRPALGYRLMGMASAGQAIRAKAPFAAVVVNGGMEA